MFETMKKRQKAISYWGIRTMVCAATLSGCVGATRLPTRSKGPAGETFQKKELDLSFLEQGTMQRTEVVKRLAAIDTTYSNPRLFWGRWSDSKWGYWWFIAGGNAAAGDAKRVWRVHNLLVTFKENGEVEKKMVLDDDKELWRELHAQLEQAPALDLEQPLPLGVAQYSGLNSMTLTEEKIQIAPRKRNKPTVEIAPTDVVRISHHGFLDKGTNIGITCHAMHLAEKSAMGKRVFFCADAPSVAAVLAYFAQHGRKDLLWE